MVYFGFYKVFFLNGFVVGKMVMYMYNGNFRELLKVMGYVEYFF